MGIRFKSGICLVICIFTAQIAIAIDKEFDCARSYCGCKENVEIKYEATIVSPDFIPLPNIKVSCSRNGVLGISDESGKVAFIIKTVMSPGCGLGCSLFYERESSTSYEAWEFGVDSEAKQVVLGNQYVIKAERDSGENNGMWQEWCQGRQWGSNGHLRVSGNYKKGVKEGLWSEWNCNGSRKSQGEYKNGKKEGTWIEWYENGTMKNQSEWHDDMWHGKMISWYPNGQIETETEFRNGEYYGVKKYYSRDGKVEFMDSSGHIINTE
ncbi:MAG: toxin-antitoxin system YwqK family antitoxin [Nitrospirota bacterium]